MYLKIRLTTCKNREDYIHKTIRKGYKKAKCGFLTKIKGGPDHILVRITQTQSWLYTQAKFPFFGGLFSAGPQIMKLGSSEGANTKISSLRGEGERPISQKHFFFCGISYYLPVLLAPLSLNENHQMWMIQILEL